MTMSVFNKLITKHHPDYEIIGRTIHSSESPVGIDARHTHIIIIKKLTDLEEKLDKILSAQKKTKKIAKKK